MFMNVRPMISSALPCLIITVLLGLCFYPIAGFDYVLHDDSLEILANSHFYPFNAAALWHIWTEPDFSKIYIPVNYTVLGLLANISRWWSGQDGMAQPSAGIFHVAGLILHWLNSLLVFRLLREVAGKMESKAFPFLALAGSLFFALHPAQVESCARAGNITVTFGGFLSILSLGLFIRSSKTDSGRRRWFWAASLLFGLALLTRPTAVALPAVAFAIGWAGRLAPGRVLLLRVVPWLILSAAYTLISFRFQPPAPNQPLTLIAAVERLVIAADCLLWYVSQTLWPALLSVDHGRTPAAVLSSQFAWISVPGILALCSGLFFAARGGNRWTAAGGGSFLAMLTAVSGIVPTASREGMSIVYDRHLYLPLIGAAVVMIGLLAPLRRDWRLVCGIVPICLLWTQTRSYQKTWVHSVPLFQHVVRVNPASWYGHGQLGTALLMAGQPVEAVPFLARALELNPQFADARVNLGLALTELGRDDEAEKVLLAAVASVPFQENAHNNLAVVYLRRQAYAEAEKAASEALRLNPRLASAGVNLASALAGQGRPEEAIDLARRIVSDHPAFIEGWGTLAKILFQSGRQEEALEALNHAIQLAPANPAWRALLETWRNPPPPTIPSTGAKPFAEPVPSK